ncbi:MAG: helix-turn-helix transcriptional regulator [Magnetococcales bacterium]|nr:helix-turn-helix transcriptional regulator [Magnetococcales bacterium]
MDYREDHDGPLASSKWEEDAVEQIGTRLMQRRKALGLSQAELAKQAGYGGQSSIREIESGKVKNPSKLLALATALGVRPLWLSTGQGEMLKEDVVVAGVQRRVVESGNRHVYEDAEEVCQETDFAALFTLVPRYAVHASAGPGLEVQSEQIVDHLAFKTEWLRAAMGLEPDKLALITARGDSMEPAIGDGDLLLLDMRELRTLDPSIYVVRMDQSLVAKRLQRLTDGRIRIQSDNPLYSSENVYPSEIQILGRIVWIGRKV